MAVLKRTEMAVYWSAVIGVPVVAVVALAAWDRFVGRTKPAPSRAVSVDDSPAAATASPLRRTLARLVLFVGVPVLLFAIAEKPSIDGRIERMDEGVRLGAVQQVLSGQRPYTDIYFQYGLGAEILQPLLAFRLFGTTLAAQRRLEWALAPTGLLALYALALAAFRRRWAAAAFLLVAVSRPDVWVSPRAALALAALAALLTAAKAARTAAIFRWAAAAGFLCGAACLYSLDGGVLAGAAGAAAVALLAFPRSANFDDRVRGNALAAGAAAGGAVFFLPFLAWLLINGAFGRFVENICLLGGDSWISAWGKPTPRLIAPLRAWLADPALPFRWSGGLVRWWIPVLAASAALTAALSSLVVEKKRASRTLLMLGLATAFFFVIALGRSDFEHWLRGTATAWLLIGVIAERGVDRLRALRRQAPARAAVAGGGGLALALFLLSVARPGTILERLTARTERPTTPQLFTSPRLGDVRLPPADQIHFQEAIDAIHRYAHANEFVYVFGDDAVLYFLSDRRNSTRYANLSFVSGSLMIDDALADLKRHPPACVLMPDPVADNGGRHAAIADYLRTHFKRRETAGGFLVLTPASPPPPSTNVK